MGIRFRRSRNIGGGFRINLSKSGIGWSWGTKGYRHTHTAGGRKRDTFSIPGTGISYVSEGGSGRHRTRRRAKARRGALPSRATTHATTTRATARRQEPKPPSTATVTDTVDIARCKPTACAKQLDAMERVRRVNTASTVMMIAIILSQHPAFAAIAIAGIAIKVLTHTVLRTRPGDGRRVPAGRHDAYDALSPAWLSLNTCNEITQVTYADDDLMARANGGATRGVHAVPALIESGAPFYVRTTADVEPFGLRTRNGDVCLLQEGMLVSSDTDIGFVPYEDVTVTARRVQYVCKGDVPADAKVIGHTWLRLNKDGTPRANGNSKALLCEYGDIVIASGDRLRIELLCSDADKAMEAGRLLGALVGKTGTHGNVSADADGRTTDGHANALREIGI